MATVQYDANTGKKLSAGASTTDALGNTYKQGTTFAPKITSSVPLRNDMQANAGAGYNTLSKLSAQGSVNPDSVQAGSSSLNTPSSSFNVPSIPSTTIVNNATLKNATDITLPTLKKTDVPTIAPIDQQLTDAKKQSETDFQTYLDSFTAPPSSADSYKKAQNQTGILQKQAAVNDLTGKLNGIVAQGEANKLSLVGQGRGIPEAIIGGQQAQIGRETAIAALPVQAQLSAAQGDLQSAEQNLNTLFKIYSDDAQNKYDYKKSVNEAVYNFASTRDKANIDELQKKQDKELSRTQSNIDAVNDMSLEILKNGNKLPDFSKVDFSSPNAVANAIKIAGSSLATSSNELTTINGRSALVNKKTGYVKYLDGGTPTIVQRTVNGSPVDGYTLKSGDDPYFIAQNNGISVDALKALNPNVKDWFNIQPGVVLNVPSKSAGKQEALVNILGSGKFTKEQKADLTNAINQGQDAFVTVKNQAKNVMGQTLATELSGYETAKQQMTSINSLLNDYYAKGGSTNIFSGSYEKTLNNLGTVNKPELVELATNISAALQVYRKSITGTAYSVQEGADIASIFPGINKTSGLNQAIIDGRMKAFDQTIDGTYRNVLGNSYDQLKQSSTPPADPLQAVQSYGDSHPDSRNIIIQMQQDGTPIELIYEWVKQQ